MKKLTLLMISCSLALVVHISQAAEVWVKWGTSTTGSGTMADPKVVSTATGFDAYINGQPAETRIHLLAGEFITQSGIELKNGTRLSGAGIDSTVVKLATNGSVVGAHKGVIQYAGNPTPGAGRMVVSDLTVDCNLQNQSSGDHAHSAVGLLGGGSRISRVKAINWGTTGSTNLECFLLAIWNHTDVGPATNCIIEDCVVTQPAPILHSGVVSSLEILGDLNADHTTPGPGWIWDAGIRNCSVYGIEVGTGLGQPKGFQALGMAMVVPGKMSHNFCTVKRGLAVYTEGAAYQGFIVADNTFIDVMSGFRMNPTDLGGAPYLRENFVIRDNFISLGAQDSIYPGHCIEVYGTAAGPVKNAVIQNNVLRQGTGFTPFSEGQAIYLANTDGAIVSGNRADFPSASLDLTLQTGLSNVTFDDNTTSKGVKLRAIDWNNPPVLKGDSEVTKFTASASGWYRLASPVNISMGSVRITSDSSFGQVDIEFDYTVKGYSTNPDLLGSIGLRRHFIPVQGSAYLDISQVRIGSDGGAAVYLDVYVVCPPGGSLPFIVRATGDMARGFHATPALTTTPPVLKVLQTGTAVEPADRFQYTTAAGIYGSATVTPFARTLLDDADASAGRSTLGVANTIRKLADEPLTNDDTVNNDSTLKFQMAANTKYAIRLKVFFTTGATPDFKYQVNGPAATLVRRHITRAAGASTPPATPAIATTYTTADVTLDGTGADGFIEEEIIVHNGGTGGDFVFRWAQNTSSATATKVLAGSYIEYMPF